MTCYKCNRSIPGDSLYCPYCGVKIDFIPVTEVKTSPEPVSESNPQKKGKGLRYFLLVLLLLFVATGTYYGITYTKARTAALAGDFKTADAHLIARPITQIHDPRLIDYVDACLAMKAGDLDKAEELLSELKKQHYLNSEQLLHDCQFLKAKAVFATKKLDGYRLLVDLYAVNYISDDEMEIYRNELYNAGISEYKSSNLEEAQRIFRFIDPYKDTNKYLTLIERSSYADLMQIFDFEDARQLINMYYLDSFLVGNWKTENGKYSFELAEEGVDGLRSQYTLPDGNIGEHTFWFEDETYFAENTKGKVVPLFKFDILDQNTVKVFCFSTEKEYELHRQ